MDFYDIAVRVLKNGTLQLYPDWRVGRSKDLMVRGRSFYAVWDEEAGLWSKDEYDIQRLVDHDLDSYARRQKEEHGTTYQVMRLQSFDTNSWKTFRQFLLNVSDCYHQLDENLTFANTEVKKDDYVSRRLPYSLESGQTDAWDELGSVLYAPEELAKIEWAIGAVVSGEAKRIQKFLVFYGPAGSGKSTVLNIVHRLFDGYVTTFDAKALGSSNGSFATEVFKNNPLVAIQHDGDLSRIDDNTKLNSIVSHEEMTMNEKFKPSYTARVNAFLFMGTNQPVKISDAKSGIIRRLIDVHPTGARIEPDRYQVLMRQIEFELGAIAHKCLERYREMGKNYYNTYRPIEMMLQTDVFYNYVEAVFDVFKRQDGVTLKQAYELYKEFCSETGIDKMLPQYKFREELRNYFYRFEDHAEVEGVKVRSYYSGFKPLSPPSPFIPSDKYVIDLDGETSFFDRYAAEFPAQYTRPSGAPARSWDKVTTTLADIDTSKLHYVKVPTQHIVIDFDLVDEDGEKDVERNIEEASKWPPTYTELSKSGKGVHLHYFYTGDVGELASVYDVGIEVKTLLGDASLRRKVTRCNSLEISTLTSGLPKKEKRMIENQSIKSEKGLRDLIDRNLRKEIHPGTKSSVDFIHKILDDAYSSGMHYDVRDLRPIILAFAARSTHQSVAAIKVVQKMRFVSEDAMRPPADNDDPLVLFDVEVFPNLLVVCWKYRGAPDVVRMINPTPQQVEELFRLKLVGFNNRRYDNHILYSRFLGNSLDEVFRVSQRIIDGADSALYGEAFNLSYTDIYDFSSKKQSLKKFEIELGVHHMELDLPWDEPVPDEMVPLVVEYCANDVAATEVVLEDRWQDFVARQILAELSGLTMNHTTQQHTAKIIFGDDKQPQRQFVYTDLSTEFRGYRFDGRESTYRGEVTGEGGYVYAEPGMYENVALLDVASMHPTSIIELNLFGPYTQAFAGLKEARLAIKKGDLRALTDDIMGGRLAKFVGGDKSAMDSLSYALKIVINIVYGLTSAKFANPFRDVRNVDNIVAKRGALFMIDLKHEVQKKGFTVAHIKTDSIKIPDATPEIIAFVKEFGSRYGYDFEHEVTYDKFCLVNDAVYIARAGDKWTAVGAQFQHPYVFKTLFTNEVPTFDDICETKSVTQGRMYLDFEMEDAQPDFRNMVHVGRTGSFVPVTVGGGALWRVKEDKYYHVTGTKGYLWIEREMARQRYGDVEDITLVDVDLEYFEALRKEAFEAIDYYGSFDKFVR